MNIIPAVDIMGGTCVRLVRGKKKGKKEYGDPVLMAKRWEREGASMLHVVDIDAAMEEGNNRKVLRDIMKVIDIPLQAAGGIRKKEDASELFNAGADLIVLSTVLIKSPKIAEGITKEYPGSVLIAMDIDGGNIVTNGWRGKTSMSIADFIGGVENIDSAGLIITDVTRDGTMKGIDLSLFSRVRPMTTLPIYVGGGISSISDIKKLKEIGVEGVIIGKALYEGKVSLRDALKVV